MFDPAKDRLVLIIRGWAGFGGVSRALESQIV